MLLKELPVCCMHSLKNLENLEFERESLISSWIAWGCLFTYPLYNCDEERNELILLRGSVCLQEILETLRYGTKYKKASVHVLCACSAFFNASSISRCICCNGSTLRGEEVLRECVVGLLNICLLLPGENQFYLCWIKYHCRLIFGQFSQRIQINLKEIKSELLHVGPGGN